MKNHLLHFTCMLASILLSHYSLKSQDWVPLGEGLLPIGYTIYSISSPKINVIWMTASDEEAVNAQAPLPLDHKLIVLRSIDGGSSWDVLEIATGRSSWDIVGVDEDTAWITTVTYGNGLSNALFKTENGGQTWINKLNESATGVFVRRFDETHLLVQVNEWLAYSDNNGEDWQFDTIQAYLPNEYNTLMAGNNMVDVVGDTLWVGTIYGRIVRYTSFGASRQVIFTGSASAIFGLAFADHLHGMLVNYNINTGAIDMRRTLDGGTTWEATPTKPSYQKLYNITHIPGTSSSFIAVTGYFGDEAQYYYTHDLGTTWEYGGTIANAQTNAVYFNSPQTGWVTSGNITRDDQPVLYRWQGDTFTGVRDHVNTLPSFVIFPNPAIDVINYSFENDGEVHQQTVMGASGKIISSGKVTKKEVRIELLPEGIYLLKVNTDHQQGVLPFIKANPK